MNIQPTPQTSSVHHAGSSLESANQKNMDGIESLSLKEKDVVNGSSDLGKSQIGTRDIRDINDTLVHTPSELSFSYDKDADQVIVQIVDKSSKEVLKQIPSKESVEIAKALREMSQNSETELPKGIFISKKV